VTINNLLLTQGKSLFESNLHFRLEGGPKGSPFQLVREIFIDQKPSGYAFAGNPERWTEAETFQRLTPA